MEGTIGESTVSSGVGWGGRRFVKPAFFGDTVIRLRVPGLLAYRELATRAVETACKRVSDGQRVWGRAVPEPFLYAVTSAIGEAFNNIVLHGYNGREAGDVIVEIQTHEDRMVIVLQDFGAAFDPNTVNPPDLDALPESGMGIFIIRASVDELLYRPGVPNALVLTKYYPGFE